MKWTTCVSLGPFYLWGFQPRSLRWALRLPLGRLLSEYQTWIRKAPRGSDHPYSGNPFWFSSFSFLQIEKRIHFEKKSFGYVGSFVVGLVFAAGWTPCIGPNPFRHPYLRRASIVLLPGRCFSAAYSRALGLPCFPRISAFNLFLSTF